MILPILLLFSGLTISAVAIYYSVMGLTAIFSAAVIPIAIMGISLEIGKLVTASWIKQHWERAPRFMRYYALVAVTILMLITSLGIFGFLSKAHSDQTLVSGDVQSKIAIYDEKIKTAKENIEADRRQIKQMDEAVDQIMGRSTDEKGADKANAVRKSQQKDRAALARDIEANQKTISQLNDEAAPIRAENRKVEAEVGPIKYIAAFVYGDNPDSSILERAVTWVIVLIVIVFDPLAVIMLLAAQMAFAWTKEEKENVWDDFFVKGEEHTPVEVNKHTQPEVSNDSGGEPLVPTIAELDRDVGEPPTEEERTVDVQAMLLPDPVEPETILCYKCGTPLINAPGIGPFCPNKECTVMDAVSGETVELPEPTITTGDYLDNDPLSEREPNPLIDIVTELEARLNRVERDRDDLAEFIKQSEEEKQRLQAQRDELLNAVVELTKAPETQTIAPQETLSITIEETAPVVKEETVEITEQAPVITPIPDTVESVAVKKSKTEFGTTFPDNPERGDMMLRVDFKPSKLFKWNDVKWIEVNKAGTDAYVHDDAYIEFLRQKLASREYSLDDLTPQEQQVVGNRYA